MLHDSYNVARFGFSTNYYYLVISIWRINYSHSFMIIITIFAAQEYFSILNILSLFFCLLFRHSVWVPCWFIEPWTTFYRILISSHGVVDMWNENTRKKSDEKQRNNAENDPSWNMECSELLRVLNLHFNLSSYTESVLRRIIIGWIVSLKCKKAARLSSVWTCVHTV